MVGPDKPAITVGLVTCTCSSQQGIRTTCLSHHPIVNLYMYMRFALTFVSRNLRLRLASGRHKCSFSHWTSRREGVGVVLVGRVSRRGRRLHREGGDTLTLSYHILERERVVPHNIYLLY